MESEVVRATLMLLWLLGAYMCPEPRVRSLGGNAPNPWYCSRTMTQRETYLSHARECATAAMLVPRVLIATGRIFMVASSITNREA